MLPSGAKSLGLISEAVIWLALALNDFLSDVESQWLVPRTSYETEFESGLILFYHPTQGEISDLLIHLVGLAFDSFP